MPNIGPMEVIIVLVIALLILGPKKLPEVGRSVGNGIREFKGSITGGTDHTDHGDTPRLATHTSAKPADDEAAAGPRA